MSVGRFIGRARSWVLNNPAAVALGGILLFGLLMRLPCMNYSISPDEASSVEDYIRRGFRGIFIEHYHCGNHQLVSFLGWIGMSIFGESDWALQLAPLAAGMGAIALIYFAGKRAFQSKAVGLTAAFLLTWAPYHVAYSANMRGYTLIIFFSLLTAVLMQANLTRATWGQSLGIGIATFLMAMSQLASMLILSAFGGILAVYAVAGIVSKKRRTRTHWINFFATCAGFALAAVLIEIGYRPVFSLTGAVLTRVATGQWPADVLTYLCGAEQTFWHPAERFEQTITGFTGAPFLCAVALAALGCIVGLASGCWGAGIYGAALVFPALAVFVVSLKLEPRYTITLLPFFVLSFGAGITCCVRAISRIFAAIPRVGGGLAKIAGTMALVALMCYFGAATVPIYANDFPHGPMWLACILQDYKSATLYLADHMSGDDAVGYRRSETYPADHYMYVQVCPRLRPSPQLPERVRYWYISPNEYDQYPAEAPAGENPVRMAVFRGCAVWVSELPTAGLRKMPLPPFQPQREAAWPDRLAPWTWRNSDPERVDVFISQDARNPDSPVIEISAQARDVRWNLAAPDFPCTPGKQVVFRADIRGRTDTRSPGITLQFLDENGQLVEEWPMWASVASDSKSPAAWKPYQLRLMAPAKARTVRASLGVRAPVREGETFGYRNLELWIDEPPAIQ